MADFNIADNNMGFGTFGTGLANTRWILKADRSLSTTDQPAFVANNFEGTEVLIAGSVSATGFTSAITMGAVGAILTLTKTASVTAFGAIVLGAVDTTLINNGAVTGTDDKGVTYQNTAVDITNTGSINAETVGICANGSTVNGVATARGATITNSGIVEATDGIFVVGTDNMITLKSTSRILTENRAIYTDQKGDFTLVNSGRLTGDIVSADGVAHITNTGKIKGDMRLGDGEDFVNMTGGKFDGVIYGGEGNDTYVISDTDIVIVEYRLGGTDTIKTSASLSLVSNLFRIHELENIVLTGSKKINATGNDLDNELTGNKAANVLRGGEGADTLSGGKGNDTLFGGDDADIFLFGGKGGRDVIADLHEDDVVRISNWTGIESSEDLIAHAKNAGKDVVISAGDDALVIRGLHKADLATMHFEFV